MKFKSLIFLLLISCTTEFNKNYEKTSFSSSGFAYIYSEQDFNNKIIKKKFDNTKFLVAHSKLKTGTLIKLTNPNNNKSVNLKVYRKLDYPELYQVLITEPVANKLNLKKEVPYVEIEEIKKNKSFIADRAKTFNEEKKVQKLLGLISLCPKCHQVKHFGRTSAIGKQAEAFKHMEKVNNWNHKQCLDHLKVAMSEWRERSKYQWFIDLSYLNEKYERHSTI